MKFAGIILLLAALVAVSVAQQTYTNRFDNVDIDNILSNNRILGNYIKCLLEKGPCTQEGRELKKLLPDALASNCERCTDTQRKNSSRVIRFLESNRAQDWKKLLAKYDPQGNYNARALAGGN